MDPELKGLLEENIRISKDNHRMLRAMRRDAWFGFFGKLLFWAAVIILPFYLYSSYVGPLMQSFSPASGGGQKTSAPSWFTNLLGLPSQDDLQKIIDQYKVQ